MNWMRVSDSDDERAVISKKLSYVLRHGAKQLGLKMNNDGFVEVSDLLQCEALFHGVAEETLLDVVEQSNASKQRYDLLEKPTGKMIRASGKRTIEGVQAPGAGLTKAQRQQQKEESQAQRQQQKDASLRERRASEDVQTSSPDSRQARSRRLEDPMLDRRNWGKGDFGKASPPPSGSQSKDENTERVKSALQGLGIVLVLAVPLLALQWMLENMR